MNEFHFLMEKQAKTYFNDNHLWLSVFNKPTQSDFSRIDRVTCCFLFHYLAMFLNILYYQNNLGLLPNSIQIDLVLFKFSIEQVCFFLFEKYKTNYYSVSCDLSAANRTKCRFRHKTGTDINQTIQYRHRKVLIMTFFMPVLTGHFQLVQVLCRDRQFVLVPVPLKGRKKRCILGKFKNKIIF